MKNKSCLFAALTAAFVLSTPAFAAQVGHPAATEAHGGGAATTAATSDDSPMAWRVASYPFRVGYSIVRTPLILGQTFTGKRTFVSDRGLFQMNEPVSNDRPGSQPQGRGQRNVR